MKLRNVLDMRAGFGGYEMISVKYYDGIRPQYLSLYSLYMIPLVLADLQLH